MSVLNDTDEALNGRGRCLILTEVGGYIIKKEGRKFSVMPILKHKNLGIIYYFEDIPGVLEFFSRHNILILGVR